MELYRKCVTAQDLFKALSEVPEHVRERLHITLVNEQEDDSIEHPVEFEAIQLFEGGVPVEFLRLTITA